MAQQLLVREHPRAVTVDLKGSDICIQVHAESLAPQGQCTKSGTLDLVSLLICNVDAGIFTFPHQRMAVRRILIKDIS